MLQLTKNLTGPLACNLISRIKYSHFHHLTPMKSTAEYSTSLEHKAQYFKKQYGLDEKDFIALVRATENIDTTNFALASKVNNFNNWATNRDKAIKQLINTIAAKQNFSGNSNKGYAFSEELLETLRAQHINAANKFMKASFINSEGFVALSAACTGAALLCSIGMFCTWLENKNDEKFLQKYLETHKDIKAAMQQDKNPAAKAQAQVMLGKMYLYEKRDYEKALLYLQPAAEQNINADAKALAESILGELYSGHGSHMFRFGKALYYLQRTVDQDVSLEAKARGQYTLGKMYYYGRGVLKDREVAFIYLKPAAEQNADAQVKIKAQFFLGQHLYKYCQGEGVWKAILANLQPVADQNEDVGRKIKAMYMLGDQYFTDNHHHNYQKALPYLEPVAKQNINRDLKKKAQIIIMKIKARSKDSSTKR